MNKIIVIDTDVEFVSRFAHRLEVEQLLDQYQVSIVVPKTILPLGEMIRDCVEQIEGFLEEGTSVSGIFVDIVIIEGATEPETTGIEIARVLRDSLPSLPLFLITAKYMSDTHRDVTSKASLEDVDGVLFKDYLEGKDFSTKRLRDLFQKAVMKRRHRIGERSELSREERSASSGIHGVPKGFLMPNVREAFNYDALDARLKAQLMEIGEVEFWNLLSRLIPNSEGILSYMRPGRSGAYVFNVHAKFKIGAQSATRPKGFVVKISLNRESLDREIRNHSDLARTPLRRTFYARTISPNAITIGSLAGILIELEEEAAPLLRCFDTLEVKRAETLLGGISEILQCTYGDPVKKLAYCWKQFYKLSPGAVASVLSFFEEHRTILPQVVGAAELKRVKDFVRTGGETEEAIVGFNCDVDTRTVHGDLNAGNLLVDQNGQPVLIDFSSRGQNHIVRDVAKLERDIVFKVSDSNSYLYFDWSRVKVWESFSHLNARGKIFDSAPPGDFAANSYLGFITRIRGLLRMLSPTLDDREYLCGLLHYSLLALAHPDVSMQKKAFCVTYITHLLENF